MATLAIKGHATRGKEVIELLEMLGGRNTFNERGNRDFECYFISNFKNICSDKEQALNGIKCFTLEQFLEKFPYKVGDKVKTKVPDIIGTVINMRWVNNENTIVYNVEWNDATKSKLTYYANGLQPYTEQEAIVISKEQFEQMQKGIFFAIDEQKEEPIEEKSNNWGKWDLPEGYEFQDGNGNVINATKIMLVKKQPKYPKTYEECCSMLFGKTDFQDFSLVLTKFSVNSNMENRISPEPPYIDKINAFYELLICRDAYWKIAGDWKPALEEGVANTYHTIHNFNNKPFCAGTSHRNAILSFPTEEMRDAFYENFKELINGVKELL